MTVYDLDPKFPKAAWPAHWKEVKERGSFAFESIYRTKDCREYPVEVAVNYLEFGGRELNCSVARDITERKQMEQVLRDSEERYLNSSWELKEKRQVLFAASPKG
jgi:PAS domain-containing protein